MNRTIQQHRQKVEPVVFSISMGNHDGFRTPPFGYLLEFCLVMFIARIAPEIAPGLMGLIWPETVDSQLAI